MLDARSLLVACAVSLAVPVRADSARFARLELDPARTVVAFHLAATLHAVDGTFALTNGTLLVDESGRTASGTVVVDANSGHSGNAGRDARMTRDILDGERFPEMQFRAERAEIEPGADGRFHGLLYGAVTVRGADHAVAVAVDGRLDGDAVVARGRFTVPYVAWGMPDPSLLVLRVAKSVDVEVTTEGRVIWIAE
jgi:polyisoprenoid-binding protein YceI